MSYYLLKQDVMAAGAAGVGGVPEEIEPGDWIRGNVMPAPANPLRVTLADGSGELRSDVIEGLLTLYSTRLKDALAAFGVDNVEFFPVELETPEGRVEEGYWLANVVGRAACVDRANSDFTPRRLGPGLKLKSFRIDAAQAPEQPIFRLAENATLVVINEALKKHLENAALVGTMLQPTEEYDGN